MRVPLYGPRGMVEILDSRDLTDAEWARVKNDPSGALRYRDDEPEES